MKNEAPKFNWFEYDDSQPVSKVYLDIYNKIESFKKENKKDHIVIAIEGKCGSGKTSICKYLKKKLDARIIHGDDFTVPNSLRTEERDKEIGGNIHYERLKDQVINNLDKEITHEFVYPWTKEYEGSKTHPIKNVTIIEGTYILHPYLGKYYDLAFFLTLSESIQLDRIRSRVPKNIYDEFIIKWIPYEKMYFEKFKIEEKCNYIINTDEF